MIAVLHLDRLITYTLLPCLLLSDIGSIEITEFRPHQFYNGLALAIADDKLKTVSEII